MCVCMYMYICIYTCVCVCNPNLEFLLYRTTVRSVICVAPPHVYRPRVNVNQIKPDSLDAQLFPFVVFAVAPARAWMKIEVDALGVVTISRGCFECSCSKKKTCTHWYNRITFVS